MLCAVSGGDATLIYSASIGYSIHTRVHSCVLVELVQLEKTDREREKEKKNTERHRDGSKEPHTAAPGLFRVRGVEHRTCAAGGAARRGEGEVGWNARMERMHKK